MIALDTLKSLIPRRSSDPVPHGPVGASPPPAALVEVPPPPVRRPPEKPSVQRPARSLALERLEPPPTVAITPLTQGEIAQELRGLARQMAAQITPASSIRDRATARHFAQEARRFAALQAALDDRQAGFQQDRL